MSTLLVGLLSAAVVTTNPPAANPSHHERTTASDTLSVTDPNDPVEQEFQNLMEQDDAAQDEVDGWIKENQAFAAKGAGLPKEELNQRIRQRFEPIRKGYEDFIQHHPDHARARVAYGSFLGDIGDHEGSQQQWEKALDLNTNDPAVYNNLANLYGEIGPVKKSFEYYARAIALNPREPVYYQNFGTTVYLFRKDAIEFYGITEQEVFNRALELYQQALKLAPDDFPLASDVAQTYYGIKPTRTDEALAAWKYALSIAHDDIEREGVYIHFARFKLNAGRFDEARHDLESVTNEMYAELKRRVSGSLAEREEKAKGTNQPAAGQR
jgi:tetratricopeptide (TPR) repeat protein